MREDVLIMIKSRVKRSLPPSLFNQAKRFYLAAKVIPAGWNILLGRKHLTLRLDTTNTCNLRCKYCYSLSLGETNTRFMTIDEFKNIADDLFHRATTVYLSCAWEPLMNKLFGKFIQIASHYGIPNLGFVTNGQLLNDELIMASIEAPVHEITISIDAATKDIYEEIRENASFDKTINNLKRIYDLKKKNHSVYPKIIVNYTAFEQNALEAPIFIQKYQEYFDQIRINHLLIRMRNKSNPYTRMSEDKFRGMIKLCKRNVRNKSLTYSYGALMSSPPLLCSNPVEFVLISSNGDVTLCNKRIIGNIFETSYSELIKLNETLVRKMVFTRDKYCKKCGS